MSVDTVIRSGIYPDMPEADYHAHPALSHSGARPCSIDGCDSPVKARGWCNRHYLRWNIHGDPLAGGRRQTPAGEPLAYFLANVDRDTDDCIEWPYVKSSGYGMIWTGGEGRAVHRMACERAHGPVPAGLHTAHSCDNPACFNPRHLRWATVAENAADRVLRGRARGAPGEAHPHAKLTWAAVAAIRARRDERIDDLAAEFGVSPRAVRAVLNNESWAA